MTAIRWAVRNVARLIGKIHAPFSHKSVNAYDYDSIKEIMEPGDILLTRTRGELTNLFIPGFWKHAAICGQNKKLVEAVGEGVRIVHLFDFLRTKDFVVVVRPQASGVVREAAAFHAIQYVGAGYDFEFDAKDSEFYCSELVNRVYKDAGQPLLAKDGVIYPSDYAHYPVVYLSVSAS